MLCLKTVLWFKFYALHIWTEISVRVHFQGPKPNCLTLNVKVWLTDYEIDSSTNNPCIYLTNQINNVIEFEQFLSLKKKEKRKLPRLKY